MSHRQTGRLTPDSVAGAASIGGGNIHNSSSSGGGPGNNAPFGATTSSSSSSSSSSASSSAMRSGTLNLSAVRDVYAAAAGLPPSSHSDANRSGDSSDAQGSGGRRRLPRLAAAVVWVVLVLMVAIVGSVSFYLVTAVLFPIKARSVVTTMTLSVLLQV